MNTILTELGYHSYIAPSMNGNHKWWIMNVMSGLESGLVNMMSGLVNVMSAPSLNRNHK